MYFILFVVNGFCEFCVGVDNYWVRFMGENKRFGKYYGIFMLIVLLMLLNL